MEQKFFPYEPPKSSVEVKSEEALALIPASRWLRFANQIIDYVGFTVLSIIFGVLIGLIFGEKGIEYLSSLPDIFVGLPIVLGYYICFEQLTGRTLGEFVTGTKVVNEDGLKPSFGQILGRTFTRMMPFEAFTFLGETGRGLHGTWPNSYVVKYR